MPDDHHPAMLQVTAVDDRFGTHSNDTVHDHPGHAITSFTQVTRTADFWNPTAFWNPTGVIRLRFGLTDGQPHTLDQIGHVYGVTREIEIETMSKLRQSSRSRTLRGYLD